MCDSTFKQPVTTCNTLNTKSPENVNSEKVIYNGAKTREALMCIDDIISHIEVGNVRDILHAYKNIHDRIRIALTAPPEPIGNAAKVREALAEVRLLLARVPLSIKPDIACGIIASKAKSALAEPPRNCDVGTAEEQDERFKNFCLSYYEPCNVDGECWKCPLFRTKPRCSFVWGQLPYEEGGAE